ncbi:MAG: hypothetical protein GXP08_07195 [Gammaproteobacteria bacterium]|nr:hypothetical protein [Gammaproteobacteria bacterium]
MDEVARKLIKTINANGELPAKDFLRIVPRQTNDYRDYFIAANLMHAGYFDFDVGNDKHTNPLGETSQETAIMFAQIMLPKGESFEINGCPRDSWHDFPVNVFSTARGFLKLEEIIDAEQREKKEHKSKRKDYFMAIFTGILAAVLSSVLFNYYALERSSINTPKKAIQQGQIFQCAKPAH